ncbi:hypothetical protein WR25_11782 [Diploscapter pachys]|uniref:Uncharacterized protein n=1 Tax=Diploscapter pachys TaxID=2018661 RepID=A0A2A2J8S7_9BILA|nr:hypothetical protein WR25_11782 [Diploscapter pachys]
MEGAWRCRRQRRRRGKHVCHRSNGSGKREEEVVDLEMRDGTVPDTILWDPVKHPTKLLMSDRTHVDIDRPPVFHTHAHFFLVPPLPLSLLSPQKASVEYERVILVCRIAWCPSAFLKIINFYPRVQPPT